MTIYTDPSAAPAPPLRGSYRTGRARQRTILAAATRVFAADGYRGGSLRDVARDLGVSPGAILHHFGSKEQLLIAVLADRDEQSRSTIEEFLERHDTVGSLRAIVAHDQAQPGLMRLFTTLAAEAVASDHPAHAYFTDRYRRLQAFIAAGLDGEGFVPRAGASTSELAGILLGMMDGMQLQWLLEPRFSMVERFDRVLVAHGLLA